MSVYNKELATEALEHYLNENPHQEMVFSTVVGSYMYGLDAPHSDIDLVLCYSCPTKNMLALRKPRLEKQIKFKGVDMKMYEVEKFTGLMIGPNLNMIEMIHSPLKVGWSNDAQRLFKLSTKCLSLQISPHIDGIIARYEDMCQKEYFSNPKNLLQLIRQYLTGIMLYDTGNIVPDMHDLVKLFDDTYQYPPHFETLADVVDKLYDAKVDNRTVESYELDDFFRFIPRLKSELTAARRASTLPDKLPDSVETSANDIILNIRQSRW